MGQWYSHLTGPRTIGVLNIAQGPSAGLTGMAQFKPTEPDCAVCMHTAGLKTYL